MYTHAHMYVYILTNKSVHTYIVHLHRCPPVPSNTFCRSHVYIYIHTCAHVHIYTHKYVHTYIWGGGYD